MYDSLTKIIREDLPLAAQQKGRSLFMPGDGRYQPEELKLFLGYDMWASFLIIVEWFWLVTLAEEGFMPSKHAALLTRELLVRMLTNITTTKQDAVEKITKHDILALLELMRKYLPKPLHRYLHLGATSYDIICTAYALILKVAFAFSFWPKLREVDKLWRNKIDQYTYVVQAGRTHLQTALPVTVGLWLACLHHQYNESARNAHRMVMNIPGKFSGAVGTSAALKTMLNGGEKRAEKNLLSYLGMKPAEYSTQITSPQDTARFYFELVLLSGVLGNLGEDVRILQSSQFGEIISVGSSSSTMAHKKANPILAENICGMHVNITAEFTKVMLTLVSDLQRDLRWSSVMRSFSAIMVYSYQQITTTERLLNSLAVDEKRINENFNRESKLVMGELLHLCLQRQGYAKTHELVNKKIVPGAAISGADLPEEMNNYLLSNKDRKLKQVWKSIPNNIIDLMKHPEKYIGNAIGLARNEVLNELTLANK